MQNKYIYIPIFTMSFLAYEQEILYEPIRDIYKNLIKKENEMFDFFRMIEGEIFCLDSHKYSSLYELQVQMSDFGRWIEASTKIDMKG